MPRTNLHEVTKQGGASGPTLEPNEKWGLREVREGEALCFTEGVENGGACGGVDFKVA